MERIVQKIELSSEELQRVLWAFGLTAQSAGTAVAGGRLANNLLVATTEISDVIVRVYPRTYAQAKVQFEVDVLTHLSERGCRVPRPIRLSRERGIHQAIYSTPDVDIFLYQALNGSTVHQSELSKKLAASAGRALAKLMPHSATFTPSHVIPHGDLGFIAGLLRAAKERDEGFASHPIVSEMERIVSDAELVCTLYKATRGIVHGDYFYENVLVDETGSEICGILDFGDAYIGAIINDVLIGAMEFSVLEDESWDLDCFDAFLRETKSSIVRERIPAALARRLLLANCIRFAVYTLPFSNAEGIPVDQNRYVARFTKISSTDLGTSIESIWRSYS